MGYQLNREFSMDETQMSDKYLVFSTLVIRKIKMKTALRFQKCQGYSKK